MKSRKNAARGIVLIISAVFIFVSLASFDQKDWGSFWNVSNLCGPIGAAIGGALIYILGFVFSWLVPLFLAYWAYVSFKGTGLGKEKKRLTCFALLVWFLFSLVSAAGKIEYGGWLGSKTVHFLELIAGRIGSVLVLIGAVLVTSFVLFFRTVKSIFARIPGLSIPRMSRAVKRKATNGGRARPSVEPEPIQKPVPRPGDREERPPAKITVVRPKRAEPGSAETGRPIRKTAPVPAEGVDMPLPDLSLLDDYDESAVSYSKQELIARSEIIESKLKDYGLNGKVQKVRPGPVVTTFEFVPAPGVKVSQIASRSDDISLALAARAIRIQAPIPGKGAVGIEVPNPEPRIVYLKEMMEHYPTDKAGLRVAFGKTVTGEPFFADLADMPHLLIAGSTGSGKSVCINSIICSLLLHHTPNTCRFILVDPKRLELITYDGIPHLLHPVITEAKVTLKVLQWMTMEMDRRYKLLASVGVKNIQSFNRKAESEKLSDPETGERLAKLPYYVTIIDELADIMVMMGNEIYPPITRLSQMARAVGIHLVLATQRPSVDIVTGLIKANFPCRIAFQVASKIDSRTILDINGAEKLLGDGDMLYLPKNRPSPIRIQGAFISEAETDRVAAYWMGFRAGGRGIDLSEHAAVSPDDEADIDDELFNKAKELVIIHQQGSISLLQRRLRIGYARAARLIDMLEQAGVVGPFEGSKARRVLVAREEYDGS